ncbi:pyruvate formate-lyase-activating protein (plasmid) [Telmatobacter bradus]|uniref:pyruvate formate-lyase-activating protein n=1 Tax=Telmatobacter bradus TaxID=474953 RepID=UPI003B4278E8
MFNILNQTGSEAGKGWIHSFDTSAGVDGPGLRLSFFMAGCLMRCQYCHNPDTWNPHHGRVMSVDEIAAEARRYAPMLKRGGITFTGGEPLLQAEFLALALKRMKAEGYHTAVDTCGLLGERLEDSTLLDIDLVLLDIKHWNPEIYHQLTGQPLEPTLRFARRLAVEQRPVWLRYVLVPGLTDQKDDIEALAEFAATMGNVERVDVLPFHQLGKEKWHELGFEYKLESVLPPTKMQIDEVIQIFARHELNAV